METKTCPRCNLTKSTTDFYKRNSTTAATYCKKCFNQICTERWRKRKLAAIQKLGGKCFDCKKTYHPNVYDFHHLYGKDYDWSKLRLRSQQQIDTELSKCVLLCANCHRERHSEAT